METKNIYQRINAVMKDIDYIQKDKDVKITTKTGNQFGYKAVTHDAVTAACRKPLVEHGVAYHPTAMERTQVGNRTELSVTIRFVNIDDPKDYIDVPVVGYGIDEGDKGPGKAISYAVKYALLKTLGLETGDDPDNDPNVVHEPPKAPPIEIASQEQIVLLKKLLGAKLTMFEASKGSIDAMSQSNVEKLIDHYSNEMPWDEEEKE